ncbi:hypothetical protein SAMN04487925_112238 [Bradyrhizobium sp. cf659]|nr:hypothetical protein SAMN04487925_112238 [Bradyrhizobium sp. cf659]
MAASAILSLSSRFADAIAIPGVAQMATVRSILSSLKTFVTGR